MTATTGGDDDRLSELSDDLLRRILYFVPSKQAAFTSMLSRRWGSLWRSSGAVNLAVQVASYQRLSYGGSDHKEAEEAFFSKQEAFVRGAMAALDAAEAPITRLTLRVESNDLDNTIRQFLCQGRNFEWNMDVVGAVVSHQAARRVEELRIAAVDITETYLYEQENNRHAGFYGLASLPSETLCVLDLTRCDLSNNSSSALMAALPLPRLVTLRLRFCSVELEVLRALLDAAPELTAVQLEYVYMWPPNSQRKKKRQYHWFHHDEDGIDTAEPEPPVLRLSFQAATTLELALCGMPEQDSEDDGYGRASKQSSWAIEIDAPRLQSFKYKGHLRQFILRAAAPGVARVDLHFLRRDPDSYRLYGIDNDNENEKEATRVLFWQFLHNFINARTLKLKVGNDLKDVAAIGKARRARLLCAFPRVQRLELEGMHRPKSKTAAVAIANLLHCCPVLGEIVLKLSDATTALQDKGSRYGREYMERKDRSDYHKSMDRFMRRGKANTTMSMEDSIFGDIKYNDVPSIPNLSGRSFACLQHTLRIVGLQFRPDNNSSSSCLGLRLIKFFADHAMVLEEMRVDIGNRRIDDHQTALAAESSSQLSVTPGASVVPTTDHGRSTVRFMVLPLQR